MGFAGLNTLCHDTSSALLDKDLKAIEEERCSGIKHQNGFFHCDREPIRSMRILGVLKSKDIALSWDLNLKKVLDYGFVGLWDNFAYRNRSRIVSAYFKQSLLSGYLRRKRFINSLIKKNKRIRFFNHHLSHAASAYRVSSFKKSNILVMDAAGEDSSTSLFFTENEDLELFKSFGLYNSLGTLYKRLTEAFGLGEYGEGKTMALASYAQPKKNYSFVKLNSKGYFIDYNRYQKINFRKLTFQKKADIAASLQHSLNKVTLSLVKELYEITGYKNLCLAGGVALNCSMNSFLLNSDYVKNIFIQPAANDAGTALGAALELAHSEGIKFKEMKHAYLGPSYTNEQIKAALKKSKLNYNYYKDIEGKAAELLSKEKILAWFQGKMEFGPRALGNRSILADPSSKEIRDKVNKIKQRELWRPLAPSILEEQAKNYFINTVKSPFMTLTFRVKPEKKQEIEGVIHIDDTARLQTVSKETNKTFYNLVKDFYKLKGLPLLLNTSFNSRGIPIVMAPDDAISEFIKLNKLGMDYLVIGNYLVEKR